MKASSPKRPCPYGASCYRKGAIHREEFTHPSPPATPAPAAAAKEEPRSSNPSSLPACQYGVNCYRKNLLHFAEYWHPVKSDTKDEQDDAKISSKTSVTKSGEKVTTADPSTADTDSCDSEEDAAKTKSNPLTKRGLSLVKNFSRMTEAERKELIQQAIEAKLQVEKKLEKAKKVIKEKEACLEEMQKRYNKGNLVLEGEEEALASGKVVYLPLRPDRQYKAGSAAEMHFRLAESQFYRLASGASENYRVTLVEYVVNGKLNSRFQAAREEFKGRHGEEFSYPVLAFHGTDESKITSICEKGFLTPGDSEFKHTTDTGYYGRGVYFSEFPTYSMDYMKGAERLLLCQVLLGRVFQCSNLIHGQSCQSGYDSHTSPDGKELVIFRSDCILPCYVVHFTQADDGDEFVYHMKPPQPEPPLHLLRNYLKDCTELKESKGLDKMVFHLVGPIGDLNTSEIINLVQRHGGKMGMRFYTHVITTQQQFSAKSAVVQSALKNGIPCVGINFVFDTILRSANVNVKAYTFV